MNGTDYLSSGSPQLRGSAVNLGYVTSSPPGLRGVSGKLLPPKEVEDGVDACSNNNPGCLSPQQGGELPDLS